MADIEAGSAPAASAISATPVQPASATATPGGSGVPGQSSVSGGESAPGGAGEPPRERWADILDHARQKTRAEAEAEFARRFEPYAAFERDPLTAVVQWLEQAEQHSVYGPLVQQYLNGRLKATARPEPGEEPKPDVPLVNDQGQVTGMTFSDKGLKAWHQWNEVRLKGEWDERFGKLERSNAERASRDEQQAIQHQAVSQAHETLTTLRQVPYFKDHEPAIRQALVDHPEWGDNVHAAFTHVLTTQILPGLGQAEQRSAVQALTGKGAATTISPQGTASAAPKFKSFRAAAEYYDQHPDEAAAMARR